MTDYNTFKINFRELKKKFSICLEDLVLLSDDKPNILNIWLALVT